MNFSKLLFLIIAGISFIQVNAQSDYEIRIAQNAYVKDYDALSEYIGNDNVTIHTNELRYSSNLGNKIYINFYFTARKVVADNGRTYYNVKKKGYVPFADIERVYVKGDKIMLVMNSNGYGNKVQVPGENWTEMITNNGDFPLTVKDDKKRDEVLHIIKMLRKYPIYKVRK